MTYRLMDRAGKYRWILDRGAPHLLADGTFLGFFGGCADVETTSAAVRNGQLRDCLSRMQELTQRLAQQRAKLRSASGAPAPPSPTGARNLQAGHLERLQQLQHAAGQMGQLSADMMRYGEMGRGACVP
jgi:hypothetical protein